MWVQIKTLNIPRLRVFCFHSREDGVKTEPEIHYGENSGGWFKNLNISTQNFIFYNYFIFVWFNTTWIQWSEILVQHLKYKRLPTDQTANLPTLLCRLQNELFGVWKTSKNYLNANFYGDMSCLPRRRELLWWCHSGV